MASHPLLSILIPTLPGRNESFARLMQHLNEQIRNNKAENVVEILFDPAPRGVKSIGEKRQGLMERARGEYFVFIDDDDWISADYIFEILKGCKSGVDCIGITGWYYVDGAYQKPFIHNISYTEYSEDEKAYYRPPNHLNPIKREIGHKFQFKNKNHGEDTDWAMEICKSEVLKSCYNIETVMYFYKFISTK